jgi:hypothetical protein
MQQVIVSIIVEPQFGERLSEVASRGPVWIAATPTNRAAAEAWWNTHARPGEFEGVTTFLVNAEETPEAWCAEILPTVDMHYGAYDDNAPTYDAVDVLGAAPTRRLTGLLATTGYTRISALSDGFRASRDVRAV